MGKNKRFFQRWWWLSLAYLIIAGDALIIVYFNLPPGYSTTTKIFVTPSANSALANIYDAPYTDRAVKTVSLLLSGEDILDRISGTTGIEKAEIKKSIKSNYVIGTQIIEIKIKNRNPDKVVSIAKAIPKSAEDLLKTIQSNTDEKNQIKISIAEQSLSLKEDNDTKLKILGGTLGAVILLGYLIYFLLPKSDEMINERGELEKWGGRFLGEFSYLSRAHKGLGEALKADPEAIEILRELRANLILDEDNKEIKTICVTSANKGEGKSTFISAIAALISELQKSVVIIDMDVKSPSIHQILKVPTDKGIVDYLSGDAQVKEIIYKTKIPNVWIIPVGKNKKITDFTTLLYKNAFAMFKKWLREECQFDYVLLDAPSINLTADSKIIAKQADGVIILAEQNKTSKSEIIEARRALNKLDIPVIGTVLSKSRNKKKKYY